MNPDGLRPLVDELSNFDPTRRRRALQALHAAAPPRPPEKPWVNMHMHSFFSFNGDGWSPARLVWEARNTGLFAMAVCDFDVLDGLEELFQAAELLEVRGTIGFESRVFFAEYADQEINSPGEPGVFYFMGMGFVRRPDPAGPGGAVLQDMRERAAARNRGVVRRVNAALGDIAVDYDADVLPLTPAGNATERHVVRAYFDKVLAREGNDRNRAAAVWADKLGEPVQEMQALVRDVNAFLDRLRAKLIKRGGPGYAPPSRETFPPLDTVIAMIRGERAIPMTAWLDGLSPGESDPDAQLDCLMEKGVEAVNIVPDRNWNIKDPEKRARKIAALQRYIHAVRARALPINVGTELNKPGQRFVDDFEAAPLEPYHQDFLTGAQVMIGHTRLLQYADFSYIGDAARAEFPRRLDRNRAFAAVGRLPAPAPAIHARLLEMEPARAFSFLMDCARRGDWE